LKFNGTHSHLLEHSDIKKKSPAVKEAIESHLTFGYKSHQVNSVFKKEFSETGCGVEYLTWRDVDNIRRKVRQVEGFQTSKDLEKDISEVLEYLDSQQNSANPSFYKFYANASEFMLFFTTQWQIESLQKYGHLVLIDSTHNINHSKWKLTNN
jgi:hypothetical protein